MSELIELRQRVSRLESANLELQNQISQHERAEETVRLREQRLREEHLREARLRESAEGYQALFENISAAIFVGNEHGEFLDVNPRACAMFGYSRDELLSMSAFDLLAPGQTLSLEEITGGDLPDNRITVEQLNRRRDGTIIPVEVSVSRVGATGLIQVLVLDISERKRSEAALKESEARYRSLFEDSPISLWEEDMSGVKTYIDALRAAGVTDFREYFTAHPEAVVDCAKFIKVLDVNQSTLALFKCVKEDLTGNAIKIQRDIESSRHNESKFESFRDELIARAEGQTHFANESIQYTLTGEPFNAFLSVAVAAGYEDTWAKVFVSVIDLTESRQAQKTLRESEAQLRLLTDNMVDAISQIDRQQKIIYVSPSIQRIYGHSPQDLLGHQITDLIHPDDVEHIIAESRRAVVEQVPIFRMEYRFRNANGEYLWVESATRFFYTDQGLFNGAIFGSRDITARKLAEQERQKQIERLSALREIDRMVTSNMDLKITLDVILSQVTGQLNVDAADVLLYDPDDQMLGYAAGRGFNTTLVVKTRLKVGQSYAGQAAMTRQRVLIQPIPPRNPGNLGSMISQEGFKLYCGVPLVAKGQLKGVLEIFHRSVMALDAGWLNYLDILAGQAAIAIDNLHMVDSLQHAKQELEMAYNTTIEGWSRALDLRDRETEGHSRRVMELTVRLARAFNIPDGNLIHIYRGALLHDIGKMAVADEILQKPASLTSAEWEIIHQHPTYAFQLLSPVAYLKNALDIPYCHHEKWDGSGYPRGLAGTQIPIAARIFAVVDVWDALTHNRPFRSAWPADQAMAYINEQAGKHFDPSVVNVFLGIISTRR